MAKILYAPGIEEVSGALSKVKTKSAHCYDDNMLLATHRKAETMAKVCSRAYFRKINSLPWHQTVEQPSAHVMDIRNEFVTKGAAIRTRETNLQTMASDQQAFVTLRSQYYAKYGKNFTWKIFMWCAAKKYYSGGSVSWPASGPVEVTLNEIEAAVDANSTRQGNV